MSRLIEDLKGVDWRDFAKKTGFVVAFFGAGFMITSLVHPEDFKHFTPGMWMFAVGFLVWLVS